jgi:hypothetical protein
MLVTLLDFGSVWETRRRAIRSTHSGEGTAFFNTTGLRINGKVAYRWKFGGKLRFNSGSTFDPHLPRRSLNKVWQCEEPTICASGWVQMLCRRKLPRPEPPDFYLFRVGTSRVGPIDFRSERWCSPDVQVISISEGKVQGCVEQEALVLMPKYSWIRSSLGAYYVEPEQQFWSATLNLSEREMR